MNMNSLLQIGYSLPKFNMGRGLAVIDEKFYNSLNFVIPRCFVHCSIFETSQTTRLFLILFQPEKFVSTKWRCEDCPHVFGLDRRVCLYWNWNLLRCGMQPVLGMFLHWLTGQQSIVYPDQLSSVLLGQRHCYNKIDSFRRKVSLC